MRAASFDSRGSVQVKLVAVLDVEHKIPSIQILHDEEQVFLDAKTEVRAIFVSRELFSVATYLHAMTVQVYMGHHLSLEGAVKMCKEGIFPG